MVKMKRFCPNCGAYSDSRKLKCEVCGSELPPLKIIPTKKKSTKPPPRPINTKLIPCKDCGNEVSPKAKFCPQCGTVLKKKMGCLGYVGAGFLILIILGVIGSFINNGSNSKPSISQTKSKPETKIYSVSQTKSKPETKIYNEGETLTVGYTSYVVWRSWWTNRLSDNQFLDENPNAKFLFVELTVKNNDKKARSIPPFKLIDENGAEYEANSKAWVVKGSIGILTSLNPDVKKQGYIVFDIPIEHKYKLKVSGGYWSTEDAFVQLAPKTSK